MRLPACGLAHVRYGSGPAAGAPRHSSGTWRGTRSRQPPSASALAFGIQRRTCARIQLSELHSEATLASPQMRSAIQRCDFSAAIPSSARKMCAVYVGVPVPPATVAVTAVSL